MFGKIFSINFCIVMKTYFSSFFISFLKKYSESKGMFVLYRRVSHILYSTVNRLRIFLIFTLISWIYSCLTQKTTTFSLLGLFTGQKRHVLVKSRRNAGFSIECCFLSLFNTFLANIPILYPLKSPDDLCFSSVSRDYEMEHWSEMG